MLLAAGLLAAGGYATGYVKITADAVQGSLALVAPTGKTCESGGLSDNGCMANDDPTFGLPHAGVSFQSAYQIAETGGTSGNVQWGAAPCLEVNGAWYVNLGI